MSDVPMTIEEDRLNETNASPSVTQTVAVPITDEAASERSQKNANVTTERKENIETTNELENLNVTAAPIIDPISKDNRYEKIGTRINLDSNNDKPDPLSKKNLKQLQARLLEEEVNKTLKKMLTQSKTPIIAAQEMEEVEERQNNDSEMDDPNRFFMPLEYRQYLSRAPSDPETPIHTLSLNCIDAFNAGIENGPKAAMKIAKRFSSKFLMGLCNIFQKPIGGIFATYAYTRCMTGHFVWKMFYALIKYGNYVPYTSPERFYTDVSNDHQKLVKSARKSIGRMNKWLG